MKLKNIVATLIIGASSLGAYAQDGLDNPMTKAVMDVYAQELANNPNNYEVLYRRATEYYRFNQYLRALQDADGAIRNAPAKNKDFCAAAHQLRGEIYQMLDKPAEALADFTKASQLDPTSFISLYQKANCEYELGDYAAAKADYSRLRAMDPRSAEALTGLARVSVKENNLGNAQQYMDDAVAMMPADSDIYVRRSSVRRMLGNNTGAVDDLIMAISIDSSSKAFRELVDIAGEDYPAVYTALGNAISQAPEQGMFYYIRAMIAQAHYHFPAALADFRYIIDNNMYNYAGIYDSMAQCYYALCDFDKALECVNRAISMSAENTSFFLTLARIQRAQGLKKEALANINKVLTKDARNEEALTEKGISLFGLERYEEASILFGEMIMDTPDKALPYMMQAWVLNDGMAQSAKAMQVYRRMLDAIPAENSTDPQSLRGFAQLFTNDKEGALRWAEELVKVKDTDGRRNYIAACLAAQAGESALALAYASDAMKLGYADKYQWTIYDAARVNVAPLRRGNALTETMARYAYIFE